MKKYIILAIIIAVIVTLRFTPFAEYFTLENLKANTDNLRDFTIQNFLLSALTYIGIYIFSVSLSIPGATVLTIGGGFLFGTLKAIIFINIGATCGACINFLLARYLLGDSIQKKYSTQLKKFNKEFDRNGIFYLLFVRLVPIFPFFLINIFAGLTKIKFKDFLWTTSLGIIPGSFVFAYAGSSLQTINSVKDILNPQILLVFVFFGLLALSGIFLKKLIHR